MKMAAQLNGQPFLIFSAFSGITAFAHHMYFSGIAIVIVWRFQNEGEFTEAGMADDGCECVKADAALTETGMEIASRMYERHRLLTDFLISLGVEEQTAREDACKIEHDLSSESFSAIRRHFRR